MTRRNAVSTAVAAGAVVAGIVVAGGAVYYLATTSTPKQTTTVTSTSTAVSTATSVSTALSTVTASSTLSNFGGIKILYIGQDAGPSTDAVKDLAPEIMQKYNIKVDTTHGSAADYWQTIVAQYQAGGVDYDILWDDTVFIPTFLTGGVFQSIQDLVDRDRGELPPLDQLSPLQHDYLLYNGIQYGMPLSMNFNNLWVRNDLFQSTTEQQNFEKQYGYPLTDFLTKPDWLKFSHIIEFFNRPPAMYGYVCSTTSYQFSIPEFNSRWFCMTGVPQVDSNFNPNFDKMGNNGLLSLNLQKYHLKFMPPNALSLGLPDAFALYLSGKAAVMTGWDTFFVAQLNAEANDATAQQTLAKTVHVPPIGGPKGHCVYTNIGHVIGMSSTLKDATKREAAWTVMKYVTSPDNEARRAQLSGESPATVPGWNAYVQANPKLQLTHEGQYITHSAGYSYGPFLNALLTYLPKSVDSMVAGQIDAATALKILADGYRTEYKPYYDKGVKNQWGLTIPQWEGKDFTSDLMKLVGM